MRLGVLDIGSNTGHLLVVDAHRGAAPLPAFSHKEPLRLAEHLDEAGAVSQQGIDALADVHRVGAPRRRGQGQRGHLGVRDLRGPRRRQLRRGPRRGARAHRPGDRGAVRRGRGAADLPRRTPVVRLVRRPAVGLRHRRRLARDRRWRRRGARRRLVAAARRRPPGAAALRRRCPRRRGRPPAAQADPRRDRPRRGAAAARRHSRPCGGDLEDLPVAGPDLRRRAVRRGSAGRRGRCRRTPCSSGSPSWWR